MNNQNGEKRGLKIVFIIAAIAFVVMFAILNATPLTGAVKAVLSLLSPIIIGCAIAYILNPLLRFFEFKIFKKMKNKNLNRTLSMILTYVFAALVTAFLLYLLVPRMVVSIESVVAKYDDYVNTARDLINALISKLDSTETAVEYVTSEQIKEGFASFLTGTTDKSSQDFINITQFLQSNIPQYVVASVDGVTNVILGIFISIYVLFSKEKLQAQARKFGVAMFSEQKVSVLGKYINVTHNTFTRYFVGKLFGSVCVMIIMFVLMMICGMREHALIVSFIIGITDIIPVFGPVIGAVPSFIIIFTTSPKQALIFLLLILIVQQIEGNVIAPKILGDATGISSLWVIVAIVLMGGLFGFFGMLIGVPVFAVATIIIKEIVDTRLRKKHKPVETEEYYLADAVVDPYNDRHTPIITRIVLKIKRAIKKSKKKRKENNADNSDRNDQ